MEFVDGFLEWWRLKRNGIEENNEEEKKKKAEKWKAFKTWLHAIVGFALGIGIAWTSKIGVFREFQVLSKTAPGWVDYLLTGAFLRSGSKIIHAVLSIIDNKKEALKKE